MTYSSHSPHCLATVATLMGLLVGAQPALALTCETLIAVIGESRRGLLGLHHDLGLELGHRFGRGFVNVEGPGSYREFVAKGAAILNSPPALRAERFRAFVTEEWKDTNVSMEQAELEARDFVWYLSTVLQAEDPEAAPEPRVAAGRLLELGRAQAFGGEDPELAQRYLWYLLQVTRLSVPEMAEQLRVTERTIRDELTKFGISIDAAFSLNADIKALEAEFGARPELLELIPMDASIAKAARVLLRQGVSLAAVARGLGVGRDAIARHLQETSVSWDREIDGMPEARLLEQLYGEDPNIEHIQAQLHARSGVTHSRHDYYRSIHSIESKLRRMGLVSSTQERSKDDLDIPGFGPVKYRGNLIPLGALHFARENQEKGAGWISEQLGIERGSFLNFLQRHRVTLYTASGRPFGCSVLGRSDLGDLELEFDNALATDLTHFYYSRSNRLPGYPNEREDRNLSASEKYEARLNKRLSYAFSDAREGADNRWARLLIAVPEEIAVELVRLKRAGSTAALLSQRYAILGGLPKQVPAAHRESSSALERSDQLLYARMSVASRRPAEWAELLGGVANDLREELIRWRASADIITEERSSFASDLDRHVERTGALPADQITTPPKGQQRRKMADLNPEEAAEQRLYKRMMGFSTDSERWSELYSEVSEKTALLMLRLKLENDFPSLLFDFWVRYETLPRVIRPAGPRRTPTEETSTNLYKKLARWRDDDTKWQLLMSRSLPPALKSALTQWRNSR